MHKKIIIRNRVERCEGATYQKKEHCVVYKWKVSLKNINLLNIPLNKFSWKENGSRKMNSSKSNQTKALNTLVAPIPSCVLMYKQELPLLYPDDADVKKVQAAFFDPFEYLWLRHKGGALNTEFPNAMGDIAYQVACHQRVQNIGLKTRDVLSLVPGTEVTAQERCSGHDGTYAVKSETRDKSVKIARPVVRKVDQQEPDHFMSDCPMAATHIANLSEKVDRAEHPMSLLRMAYGL